MNRFGYVVACVLTISAVLAISGCDVPDQVDSGCEDSSCTVHVRSGTELHFKNLKLDVEDVSDHTVTLGSHGVHLKLSKNFDLRLGGHGLHLVAANDDSADIEID